MKSMTATDAKTRFGQVLEAAIEEPVSIERSGRSVAVVISSKEYKRLQDAEDALWGIRAKMSEAGGFLTDSEQTTWLSRMREKLHAETATN